MPVDYYNKHRPEGWPEVRIDDQEADAILKEVQDRVSTLSTWDDVSKLPEPPVEMPYLQLILDRLWEDLKIEKRTEASLLWTPKRDLDEIGGAEALLKQHLKGQLASLDSTQQEIARKMFRLLITPSSKNIIPQTADYLAEFICVHSVEQRESQLEEIKGLLDRFIKPECAF